jgi:hypothetical protein
VYDRILGGRKTSKEHFVRERECSIARIPVRILDRNYVSRSGTARPYNQTVEKVRYPAIE